MDEPYNLRHKHSCGLDALTACDDIIDVRTPAEFADDHIPGAINAPVMSNDERARIGTLYVQQSTFQATRMGAAIVARHIAEHMDTLFADRPRQWRPLIYCWRGGKRSRAMATWFNLVGWKANQLEGGYKAWRHHVMAGLEQVPATLRFIVLSGPTGSGKTRLLQALARAGAQTLDLEALACHRGSLLGGWPECAQPGQRGFETALFDTISRFEPTRPVFVEAESRRIGQRDLPTTLLDAMHAGDCVNVQVAMPERIAFLLADYAHWFTTPDAFKQRLQRLVGRHSRRTVAYWQALIDADHRAELFQALVEQHYDPAYRRSSRTHYGDTAPRLCFAYDPTGTNARQQAQALLAQLNLDAAVAAVVTPTEISTSR